MVSSFLLSLDCVGIIELRRVYVCVCLSVFGNFEFNDFDQNSEKNTTRYILLRLHDTSIHLVPCFYFARTSTRHYKYNLMLQNWTVYRIRIERMHSTAADLVFPTFKCRRRSTLFSFFFLAQFLSVLLMENIVFISLNSSLDVRMLKCS